jgi:hypothetical protein
MVGGRAVAPTRPAAVVRPKALLGTPTEPKAAHRHWRGQSRLESLVVRTAGAGPNPTPKLTRAMDSPLA